MSIREQAIETASAAILESIPHLALSSATPAPFDFAAGCVVDALAAAGLLREADAPTFTGHFQIDEEGLATLAVREQEDGE